MNKTLAGILAFALVVSVVAGAAAYFASRSLFTNPRASLDPLSPIADSSAEDFTAVRTHKWWTKPLSLSQTNTLVKTIRESNRDAAFYIGRDGTFEAKPMEGGDAVLLRDDEYVSMVADGNLWVNCRTSFRERPTDAEVLDALLSKLNRMEYRDGAGR